MNKYNKEQRMKLMLNSLYGRLCYVDTDSMYVKEHNMDYKDYIVVHTNLLADLDDYNTSIIFKSKIMGVVNRNDKAVLIMMGGMTIYSNDSYSDIVKQLV